MTIASFILLYGLSYGLVLCLIAVGLVVTMGLMRVVNLAHGAFAAIGGYLSTGLMVEAGMALPLAIAVAVVAVGLFSLVVERLVFVHLYTAPELDQMLLTIGLNFLAIGGLTVFFGPNVYPTKLPAYLAGSVDFGFRAFEVYRLAVIVVGLAVMASLFIVFELTTVGAQLRASVDNRSMAQAAGINVPRLFSLTFVVGSGLAALGGAIGAPMLPLEPTYPFKYLVLVLIIVALSGFGRIKDALGVSILIGIAETAGRYFWPAGSGFVIYVLLIVLIVWRRDGLFRAQSLVVILVERSALLSRHRFLWPEALFWLAAVAVYFLFPQYLAIATTVLIVALFAVSYDLAIGFGGILTLGHGLFFGIGAYCAGWIALLGWTEAVSGALASGVIAALAAAALGPFLLRLIGLPLIMVTLGVSVIVYEAANKAAWLTGGDDGLTGFSISPLFGTFRWSVFGDTKYFYALGWLFVLFYLLKRVVASPFGVALQGIRENSLRMRLIGTSTLRHLTIAYSLSAGVAGVAGALSAQTNAFVSLGVLGLDTTIDGLVIVVLGGIGTLYGALIGAPVYVIVKHFAQQWNPFYWMFVIGALLIVVVRFSRGGLLGMAQAGLTWLVRR